MMNQSRISTSLSMMTSRRMTELLIRGKVHDDPAEMMLFSMSPPTIRAMARGSCRGR